MKEKKCLYLKNCKIYSTIFFLLILIVYFGLNGIKIIKNSNIYNILENRYAYRIEKPNIKSLLNQKYQNNLENAIGDQIIKYNYFKVLYSRISNFVNLNTIFKFKLNENNNYFNLKSINLYKDSLVYNYQTKNKFISNAEDDIKEINNIKSNVDANVYLYFVKTDSNFNFKKNKSQNIEQYLQEKLNLNENNINFFNIHDYNEYKKYFYKIDHHWNDEGSYKGYVDIAMMMHFNNIITKKNRVCFDNIKTMGSKIANVGNSNLFGEIFCEFIFNYPDFEIIVNGNKVDKYGETLYNLKNSNEITYAYIYGGDDAEIIFNNKEESNGKNLLVYANSYSNAINKLLATEYDKTYVVDGRYYKDFNMINYIKENNIDDVLILGNNMLFGDNVDW